MTNRTNKAKVVDSGIPEVGQAQASGVAVWCAHTKIVPLDTVKPNLRNPNHHPREQVALLGRIISETGWRHPIVISKRSGLIVFGHARRLAALKMGWTEVPVEYQNFTTEHEELSALLADNQIAELSELDKGSTLDLLRDLDKMGGLSLSGFTDNDVSRLVAASRKYDNIEIVEPPGTLWVMLSIPLNKVGELQEHLAALEEASDVVVKTNRG